MSVDHYEILGLDKFATADEIKKKYHAMVKEWHPDKYKGKNKKLAQQKISEINKSYEILGNKQKRQAYDNEQEQENNVFMGFDDTDTDSTDSSSSDSSIKDLHEFKRRLRELNEDMERTGMDERFDTDFDSSPEEGSGGYGGFFGYNNYYAQQQAQETERKRQCNDYFERLKKIGMDADANAHVTLEDIFNGTRKRVKIVRRLVDDEELEEYVEVDIKQNANEGDSINIPNMGHFVNYNSEQTTTPGNASVNVRIAPHDVYTRKDFDLYTTLEITFDEAQHGFKRTLKGLDGKTFHIALPVVNRSDITHTILQKGMRRESGTYGSLYVSYIIVAKLTDPAEKAKKHRYYSSSESEPEEKPKKIKKSDKKSKKSNKKISSDEQSDKSSEKSDENNKSESEKPVKTKKVTKKEIVKPPPKKVQGKKSTATKKKQDSSSESEESVKEVKKPKKVIKKK